MCNVSDWCYEAAQGTIFNGDDDNHVLIGKVVQISIIKTDFYVIYRIVIIRKLRRGWKFDPISYENL